MSKFNSLAATPSFWQSPPMATVSATPDTRTHEGGVGFTRTPQTELFLTCATSLVAEDSFYEKGSERTARVRKLVHTVAAEDGGPWWLLDFATWLRRKANIRTAAVVVAAETVAAGMRANRPNAQERSAERRIVDAACRRADEPGEMVAYWKSVYGRPGKSGERVSASLPNALKRGLGDATLRLYTEESTLKYDSPRNAVRFGDVLALSHVVAPPDRVALFRHLLERRHGWNSDISGLPMIKARADFEAVPVEHRRALFTPPSGQAFAFAPMADAAGLTWEWMSGWLSDGGGMDAAAWKAILPRMGYMARLRNLRNLDQAGVDDETAQAVAEMLADPEQVEKSKQFPFRFYSAYREVPSDRWSHCLGRALDASVRNIPELPGTTLVMADTSGSMTGRVSAKSSVTHLEVAALFATALAGRNQGRADLFGFADREFDHPFTPGSSVLREVVRFLARAGEAGHGTAIEQSTAAAWARKRGGYDRVVIISDMQSFGSRHYGAAGGLVAQHSPIPAHVPIYAFDLSAYEAGVVSVGHGSRFQLGGLTDATFRLIPLLEAGKATGWPWEI